MSLEDLQPNERSWIEQVAINLRGLTGDSRGIGRKAEQIFQDNHVAPVLFSRNKNDAPSVIKLLKLHPMIIEGNKPSRVTHRNYQADVQRNINKKMSKAKEREEKRYQKRLQKTALKMNRPEHAIHQQLRSQDRSDDNYLQPSSQMAATMPTSPSITYVNPIVVEVRYGDMIDEEDVSDANTWVDDDEEEDEIFAKAQLSAPEPAISLEIYLLGINSSIAKGSSSSRPIAISKESSQAFVECALLGNVDEADTVKENFYLNVADPFCLAAVGVQGSGKSHTLSCVLEGCLLPTTLAEESIIQLKQPMSALVLHFDQSVTNICEATGIISPSPDLKRLGFKPISLAKENMLVIVSPTYYKQRKLFYGGYCQVKPLLFSWTSLTADHIKRLMRIGDDDNQLYVATMLDILRNYQRQGALPSFEEFIKNVKGKADIKGQSGPLEQRIALLESLIAESSKNRDISHEAMNLRKACQPGKLVVVDLTDPLLSSGEANCIFQVLCEQYRTLPSNECGKLLVLDEAHKYMDGVASDGLSSAIVNIARLMRHDGIRLAISTQSPKALAPELLELVSVCMMHRFHSKDWIEYLSNKIPIDVKQLDKIMDLPCGNAIMFASSIVTAGESPWKDQKIVQVHMRKRLTADRGSTKTNRVKVAKEAPTEASSSASAEDVPSLAHAEADNVACADNTLSRLP
jgi:hypothetical protein